VNFGVKTTARVRVGAACAVCVAGGIIGAHERGFAFFQRQPVIEGLTHVVF
jgi:hypothetical protein